MKQPRDYEVNTEAFREQERVDREERWTIGALVVVACISAGCLIALVVL